MMRITTNPHSRSDTRAHLFGMMRRVVELGRMLPDDITDRVEARMICDEIHRTETEIDATLRDLRNLSKVDKLKP